MNNGAGFFMAMLMFIGAGLGVLLVVVWLVFPFRVISRLDRMLAIMEDKEKRESAAVSQK
jgi:hypothetical protein